MWLSQGGKGLMQTRPSQLHWRTQGLAKPEDRGQYGGWEDSKDGTYFLDSSRDVLNEQLAKVVEGLEFPGLERMMTNWGSQVPGQPFRTLNIGTEYWNCQSIWAGESLIL